jgi:hypothetical protein
MSLCFTGPAGSVEQRWIVYALLRDNVQHYLERGQPTSCFTALHGAAEALGGGRALVDALNLRAEMEQARAELLARPISDLAVSGRTLAVIDRMWPPPSEEGTKLLAEARCDRIPWLPANIGTFDQAFGHLVRRLLEITSGADEGDVVEVVDL